MPPLRNTGSAPEAELPEYAGRYELESCLGSGGMGVVHLATSASGMRIAVKVIHADHAQDSEFRARFRQEVAAARRVSGAFTAPVVDADPEAPRPWMATLFIDGPTLSEQVKRNGPLKGDELVLLGAGLAEGLRDIHRAGVVHRDLKPSNVLLAADGPKVIDFGISRPTDSDLRTETGKLIGTPPFMAPEQFQRPRDVGPAADVFAMGAVLVHAATGRGPFDSDSPYVVAYQVVHNDPNLTGVPENLLPLIKSCLAKQPEDRPTPDELMAMLHPSSRGATPFVPARRGGDSTASAAAATHPRAAARPRGPLARPRVRWAAAGVALVLVAAGCFLAVQGASGHGAPGTAYAGPAKGQTFRPWLTTLRGGTTENKAPVCSPDGASLYCTAPGVAAARINQADGHVDWSVKDTDAAGFTAGDTPPVLSGGLLYVVVPGTKRLAALDPASGEQRWEADISQYPTVRYAGDSVLLMKSDGQSVRALDSVTGSERWTRRLDTFSNLWAGGGGKHARLFAVTGPPATPTEVSSLDPRTGAVRWRKNLTGSLVPVGASDGALFLLSQNLDDVTNAVVRLDATTRAVTRTPLPSFVEQAQATVADDIVYVVGYTGSLLAVDTREGVQRWRLETSVTRASRPAVDGKRVYVSAGDGRLLAVDGVTGALLGQTKPRMDAAARTLVPTLPPPVVAPGKVVATAPDGSVFAVDSGDPARW